MKRLTTDQLAALRVALITVRNSFDADNSFYSEYQELADIFESGCGVDVRDTEEETERMLMEDTVVLNDMIDSQLTTQAEHGCNGCGTTVPCFKCEHHSTCVDGVPL